MAQEQGRRARGHNDQHHSLGSANDIRMDGQGPDGSLEFYFSFNEQEQEGRVFILDRPDLVLHPQPIVAIHPKSPTTSTFGTDDL